MVVMIVGWFIVGFGVGFVSCIVLLYIGELVFIMIRGWLVIINCVVIILG